MTLNDSAPKRQDVYWKLAYDINMPRPKVKIHHVEWDEDRGVLYIYISTSGRKRKPEAYLEGAPLYQPDETGYELLVGMSPVDLGKPPQSLVKGHHIERADRLLGEAHDATQS